MSVTVFGGPAALAYITKVGAAARGRGEVSGDEFARATESVKIGSVYIPVESLRRVENLLVFGPVGIDYSHFETMFLLAVVAKLMKTPEGQEKLTRIVEKYLDTVGVALQSIHTEGMSNTYTALMNWFVALPIYQRLGLVTSFDRAACQLYLDHMFGELLKYDYVQSALKGVASVFTGIGRAIAALPTALAGGGE